MSGYFGVPTRIQHDVADDLVVESRSTWIPGPCGLGLVLYRSHEIVIRVANFSVYPDAFEFDLQIYSKTPTLTMEELLSQRRAKTLKDDLFRFAIEFDGSTVYVGNPLGVGVEGRPAEGLYFYEGGTRGDYAELRLFAASGPRNGRIGFVCEWPSRGVPLIRTQTSARPLVEAAGMAERLWSSEA